MGRLVIIKVFLIKNYFLTSFISILLLSTNLYAQWNQANGPYGGQINALISDSNSIFSGCNGAGVFVSEDNGESWIQRSSGITHGYVNTLAINKNKIYAGTYVGVYYSSDRGSEWNTAGIPDEIVISLATKGDTLYAGTLGGGLFMTSDDGSDWVPLNNGLTNSVVNTISADTAYLFVGTSGGGIYRSSEMV